jgi:microcin C transport system substrate-binding protein
VGAIRNAGDILRALHRGGLRRKITPQTDPVIDALIEKIIAADSRSSLMMSCRVLDRVIRSGRYWVPHWYKASHWLAYWDVFDRPATKPRYARGIPETWWYDGEKAAKID